MAEEHRIRNRWGGDCRWLLDDKTSLVISDTVMSSGPGKGIVVTPWALDRYERVLRLRPGETWLLKRMLAFVWTFDGQAFPSQRKISLEARCSCNTIRDYARRLEELGYIRRIGNRDLTDSRIHYSVAGTYAALALCIAADPNSKWAKEHGGPVTPEWASTRAFNGPGYEDNPVTFDLDWQALEVLTKRRRLDGDTDEEESQGDVLSLDVWGELEYSEVAPD